MGRIGFPRGWAMNSRNGKARIEAADGESGGSWHRWIKRAKRRFERRKAKRDPGCVSTYGRYRGYES